MRPPDYLGPCHGGRTYRPLSAIGNLGQGAIRCLEAHHSIKATSKPLEASRKVGQNLRIMVQVTLRQHEGWRLQQDDESIGLPELSIRPVDR